MSARDPRRALELWPDPALRRALREPGGLAAGLRQAIRRALCRGITPGPDPIPGEAVGGRPVRLQLEPALRAALDVVAIRAALSPAATALALARAIVTARQQPRPDPGSAQD